MYGYGQITFVIEHLPQATPAHDTIFITGKFNDWSASPKYMFRKRIDGKLAITINVDVPNFEYKFNRGNWEKAETATGNRFRPNRKYNAGDPATVYVSIDNWQDMGGAKSLNFLVFYFFGVSLLIALTRYLFYKIRNLKRSRADAMLAFQCAISAWLVGRVIYEVVPLDWQFRIGHFNDIVVMTMPPLWFFTITKFTGIKTRYVPHFIPAILVVSYTLVKILNPTPFQFLTEPLVNTIMTWDTTILHIMQLTIVMAYWIAGCIQVFSHALQTTGHAEKYLLGALHTCGLLVIVSLGVTVVAGFIGYEKWYVTVGYDILPFCISLFELVITYFVFKHEEIFKVPVPTLKPDELDRLKQKLHEIMLKQKPYLSHSLNLPELADLVGMRPHLLSKVINDGFDQNFRDFVNAYRVDEFIRLAALESSKRYTYLALAFEVGFNSKSTFNAAFKKITQHSPREYFQQLKGNSLESNTLESTTL